MAHNYCPHELVFGKTVGDQVLLRNETDHKLDYQFIGPYKVTEIGKEKRLFHNCILHGHAWKYFFFKYCEELNNSPQI